MKEVEKIAIKLYETEEKMDIREFLVLSEMERLELLITLKGFEKNRYMRREEFLNKYFNFNVNTRRYIRNVGAWDGTDKQWYRFIDKVKDNQHLYPELNQKEEIPTSIEVTNIDINEFKEYIGTYVKEVINEKSDRDALVGSYQNIKKLDSYKDKANLTKLISAKLPEEAIQILCNFKEEYGFKKQEVITMALLEFNNKYGKTS